VSRSLTASDKARLRRILASEGLVESDKVARDPRLDAMRTKVRAKRLREIAKMVHAAVEELGIYGQNALGETNADLLKLNADRMDRIAKALAQAESEVEVQELGASVRGLAYADRLMYEAVQGEAKQILRVLPAFIKSMDRVLVLIQEEARAAGPPSDRERKWRR
jgi:histidyl-tRNA synthetase